MEGYPSLEEFNKLERFDGESDEVSNWYDVVRGKVLRLEKVQEYKHESYGLSGILHFTLKDESEERVWAPRHFLKELYSRRGPSHRPYFISRGTEGDVIGGKARFELVYIDIKREFQLFFSPKERNEGEKGGTGSLPSGGVGRKRAGDRIDGGGKKPKK